MHERTRVLLDRLEQAEWFADVGRPLDAPVTVVASWDAAVASCESAEFDDMLLETANEMAAHLRRNDPDLFRRWNDLVVELKALSIPLVSRKLAPVARLCDLPEVVEHTVQWIVLHALMESEYADVCPSTVDTCLADWIVLGRFPCGWDGPFPQGKLVVF